MPFLAYLGQMNKASKLQQVDLWEAWIEFDHLNPRYFGVLNVMGELEVSKKIRHPFLIKKEEDPTQLNCLVLRIDPDSIEEGSTLREVFFAEPIRSVNEFTKVVIYAGNEIIACISDLEILV